MTNLDSILKSRDIILPTKAHLVKAMVFPVVMYGCESWTIKKAERQRIDAFELWCWRRLLRVPWTTGRSNQSILKEISPEYSLEGYAEAETPILWPRDVKKRLIWRDPDAGKGWRKEEKGTTEDEMVGWHHWLVMDREAWCAAVHRVAKSRTWLRDWSELNELMSCPTLCDAMDSSMPCNPPYYRSVLFTLCPWLQVSSVLHYLPEFAQINVHWTSEAT